MRFFSHIIAILFLAAPSYTVSAQLRMVSKEKLAGVADPRLSPDSSSLQFETRHIVADAMNEDDEPAAFSYRFTNVGKETLTIRRLVSTCSCATAMASASVVNPGASAEIIVRYDPQGHPGKFERKVFVYTREGNDPSAVLRLSVDVSSGADLSREWPVQMGSIRLRRAEVSFVKGKKAVEKMRFINLSRKPLELACESMFLPECLSFSAEPKVVQAGGEGEIVITYDPSKGESQEIMKLILRGLSVPPSKSTITIYCKTE